MISHRPLCLKGFIYLYSTFSILQFICFFFEWLILLESVSAHRAWGICQKKWKRKWTSRREDSPVNRVFIDTWNDPWRESYVMSYFRQTNIFCPGLISIRLNTECEPQHKVVLWDLELLTFARGKFTEVFNTATMFFQANFVLAIDTLNLIKLYI